MKNYILPFILLSLSIMLVACTETPEGPGDSVEDEGGPEITGIQPDEGPVGIIVTISGNGFSSSEQENMVTFNGTEAEVQEATESELKAAVPEGAETGPVEVSVRGQQVTGPTFTVNEEAMSIESVEPDSGNPGTEVVIKGKNFGTNLQDIEVYFAGTEAPVSEATDTEIVTQVPEGADTGPVEITAGGETAAGPTFTVTQAEPSAFAISGTVVDGSTGQGIEGVEISFSSDIGPVYTDGQGKWSASEVQAPIAVTASAEEWDFPIHTKLVLGPEQELDFTAQQSYSPPTGTRIAYQYREGCSQGTYCDKPFSLWLMDSNGLNKEQLTDESASDHGPTWSPDASKIAFYSNRGSDSDTYQIWIIDLDSGELTNTGIEGTQPAWSPDGSSIAYVHQGNIRVMDLEGGDREIFAAGGGYAYASSPAWSPDGTKIAFDLTEEETYETHIWVMESDGGNVTQLTDQDAPNRSPAWEPSGGGILFTSRRSAVDRLRIMAVDGSNDRRRNWPDHAQTQPAWSPSGGEIVYTSRRMIPISDYIRWIPADNDAWMNVAPDSDAEAEFWANSPAWAPQ
ncbi:IPT/TIG domain-containing protein [Halalkalibaculum sp. DA384]|uniref:IPT/TIG domain-containing protein n=1 Tax=Halalkalibaculum sp. DA384 TaxID=3373606 RepID=UPI00375477C2